MIARTCNLVKYEDKVIDWYENVPRVTRSTLEEGMKSSYDIDIDKERLEQLLGQFNILLEEYPEVLKNENILNKYITLREYAKSKKIALNNCYSYINKEELDNSSWDVKGCTYGIRILPNNWNNGYKCITITGYNNTASGIIVGKKELKLKLNRGNLSYINMSYVDSLEREFYSDEVLTYLRPNILTKHL